MIGFQVGVRTGEIYSACVCFLTGEENPAMHKTLVSIEHVLYSRTIKSGVPWVINTTRIMAFINLLCTYDRRTLVLT